MVQPTLHRSHRTQLLLWTTWCVSPSTRIWILFGASLGPPATVPSLLLLGGGSVVALVAPHRASFALCFFPSRCWFRLASLVALTWQIAQLHSPELGSCSLVGCCSVVVAEIAAAAFLFTPEAFVADERTFNAKLATVRGRASSAAIVCFHRCASLTWCGPPSSPKAVARRSRWSSVMGEADPPVMATEEASEAMVKKRQRRH